MRKRELKSLLNQKIKDVEKEIQAAKDIVYITKDEEFLYIARSLYLSKVDKKRKLSSEIGAITRYENIMKKYSS